MAQFTVHKNRNPRTKATYPLLLDIQANLLDQLETRVVVPLTNVSALARKPISRLTPQVEVAGGQYLMITPQLAGISRKDLGVEVGNIEAQRSTIVSALDILITGV